MRRIIQIAVGAAAGWNGLTHHEESHFEDRDALYALSDDGKVFRLRGDAQASRPSSPSSWVELPALPEPKASKCNAISPDTRVEHLGGGESDIHCQLEAGHTGRHRGIDGEWE